MRLTSEQIDQYKRLYKDRFGKPILNEEALEQGLALVRLVRQLHKSKNELEDYHEQQTSEVDL